MDIQVIIDIIQEKAVPWFLTSGLKIIGIIIATLLINRFGKIGIDKVIRSLVKPPRNVVDPNEEIKRENTLISIFHGVIRVVVWAIAVLTILAEVGINITPLLAGAGVLGLAIGFGAQSLVSDMLAGLFIMMEDQYRVGDVVNIAGTGGSVQSINLRKTTLRDLDGIEHHIPNGEIKKASNLSKGFARINLNVGIAYDSDLEKVIKVVNQVGEVMANDPEWKDSIIKAPKFLRVNEFADSAIIIKILGDTKPLKQWGATGELRKRIKIAFDKEGIRIPFPQMVVWQGEKLNKDA